MGGFGVGWGVCGGLGWGWGWVGGGGWVGGWVGGGGGGMRYDASRCVCHGVAILNVNPEGVTRIVKPFTFLPTCPLHAASAGWFCRWH